MENKELDEILQKYVESTRDDRDIAFKKLNEKSKEFKQKKKIKWQYIFSAAMCVIIIVLCITLPITLVGDPTLTEDLPNSDEPKYCESSDIFYIIEEALETLINNYKINAFYPTYDLIAISSIKSHTDSTLIGARLGYFILEDYIIDIDVDIIPKTHIVEQYEKYFTLQNDQKWREYEIKYFCEFNTDTAYYDMKIYFTDGKYDYFVEVSSEEEIEPNDLLNILYS